MDLSFNEYQQLAMRTFSGAAQGEMVLVNAAMGLCGESGEVADHLKKHLFQGHELNVKHLSKEVGDILWYCALFAEAAGISLGEIAQANVDKLKARYPDGFTVERSLHRTAEDD